MDQGKQFVLIKNYTKRYWVCMDVDDVVNSRDEFHRPLEVSHSGDPESLRALDFMAKEMNRSKGSEKFWISHAGKQSATGKRVDYALVLLKLESKSVFDTSGKIK